MGVTIQADMLEAARLLPDEQGRDLIYALVTYGIEGELPDEVEPWYPMWLITKGRIEASVKRNRINEEMNRRKSQKAKERKSQREDPEGEPNGNSQWELPDEGDGNSQGEPEGEPTTATQENAREVPRQSPEVRGGVERKGKEKGGKGSRPRKRFRAPTVQEVSEYAEEQSLNVDAVRFCDYYESCGWTVGRNRPMRDWRAAARRWSRNEYGDTSREVSADGWYDFASLNAE